MAERKEREYTAFVRKMKNRNIILKNKMELIRWEDTGIPVVVYCHPRRGNQYVYSHWHKELEITCIFEGEVEFYNGGNCRILKSGGVNISNSREMHYAVPRKAAHDEKKEIVGITILINDTFLHRLIPDLDNVFFVVESQQAERELAEKLEYICKLHCQNENLENKIRILAAVCELIAVLVEKCQKQRTVVSVKKQRYRERTEAIIEYLNEHYKEKLQQQELADRFHFSREYFARFFKTQTGMTFKEYIVRYRLEKARDELIRKDNNILEVALQNGFSSETQFINSFKNVFGLTPLKYRKLHKGERSHKIDKNVLHS